MEFSIDSTLRFGWETFKKRPWFFIGAAVVIAIAQSLAQRLHLVVDAQFSGSAEDAPFVVGLLEVAIYFGLSTLVGMGVTAFALDAHDNPDTVGISALWHPQPFWKFLGLNLFLHSLVLVAVALLFLLITTLGPLDGILAGILLLYVAGVIFALMFIFAQFFIIDRELGPIAALKESYRITSGHRWDLLGLLLMLTLINLLGMLALFVGLFVTVPITLLAITHAYRVLSGSAETRPVDATLAA
jgi:uncharacterized membrane protein